MLNAVIRFALNNRAIVLLATAVLVVFAVAQLQYAQVDVFPDLNKPTVTVLTEAPGLAPEEVEALVTRPIEFHLNGATGVQRIRSSSGIGLSIVWIEFDWNTDIFRDRQIVAEKLTLVKERLPPSANPVLAPISSLMGEIRLLGLRSNHHPASESEARELAMQLRTLAEFNIRNRLLSIEGVSQVTVIGGILRQYQVITAPARLAAHDVTLQQLQEAVARANVIAGGGILDRSPRESMVRISGTALSLDDLRKSVVLWRDPVPVLVSDVAEVRFGGPVRRGDAGFQVKVDVDSATISAGNADTSSHARSDVPANTSGLSKSTSVANAGPGEPQPADVTDALTAAMSPTSATPHDPQLDYAVILTVQKQPGADTIGLDRSIDAALAELQPLLPEGLSIERSIFRQADFIRAARQNVTEALRDGAIWVVIILFLFMGNFRVSVSSLTSMPLSLLLTFLCFRWMNVSLNTMTLGGIAVAIGDLVDDSIVDIENIARRLKENRHLAQPRPILQVIYDASCEVRSSIVYATLIVILVVTPLFAMEGIEGRLFAPLGLAYIVSLLASLLVSLTFTPVLGSFLLPKARFLESESDPLLLRWLKALDTRVLRFTLRHAWLILAAVTLLILASLSSLYWMGGEFLPEFNEGSLTINVRLEPGTSLDESRRVATLVEQELLSIPEVLSVARRTGRAELDEHAEGVNSSDIEVRLADHMEKKRGAVWSVLRLIPIAHLWAYETVGRSRDEVIADVRERVASIPGAAVNVGQPISHRIDHMMTGIRAQVAVKIFGSDLRRLRQFAYDAQTAMQPIPGVVDLQIEAQGEISQLRLVVNREEAARYGLSPGEIAETLETAFQGRVLSQILDGEQSFPLVLWYDEQSRLNPQIIQDTILDSPSGRKVALGQVAHVLDISGPNAINRERALRRIVVSCNVEARDLAGVVADIRRELGPLRQALAETPGGYFLEIGGQFQAQQQANSRLLLLGSLSIFGVFFLLWKSLGSWRAGLQVLANIPLAAFGSIIALLITNPVPREVLAEAHWWEWPRIWAESTTLSVAHWVGFITLIGIVSRNGIMMISHYIHLMEQEGETFSQEMIIRGSLERLAPVMMTAATSFIGLLPLLFGRGEPGKEILHPLAIVVFGGMLTSTLLDQIVTPALFWKFGRHVVQRASTTVAEPPVPPTTPVVSVT